MKNPYHQDTPEWQLFERVKSQHLAAVAFDADAAAAQRKASVARETMLAFDAALVKLTGQSAIEKGKP